MKYILPPNEKTEKTNNSCEVFYIDIKIMDIQHSAMYLRENAMLGKNTETL